MRIFKILNNNAVVVKDNDLEKIVMGSGIAFGKQKNDIIIPSKIEKIFTMNEGNKKFQELLQTVPLVHIELAEKLISYAEGELQVPLNDHIHISLTDHLSFAIERVKQGYPIQNKLLNEIKFLYKSEFKIGLWAIELVNQELNISLPEDEAGHIALHIHTAKMGVHSMEATLKLPTIISEVIELIEKELNVKVEEDSITYQRLLTHLRFALSRIENKEPFHSIDDDMLQLIKTKFQTSYVVARKIATFLENEYKFKLPESEIGYITLHIQRVLERAV